MSHPIDQPRLSIVIPAYNESHHIPVTLEQIRHFSLRTGLSVEVIIVDDGSTDATADVARRFPAEPLAVSVLVNSPNRGKGYSVRRGMLEARGQLRLMCDADMSTPITQLEKLLPRIDTGDGAGHEVVIASRSMPDSVLDPAQPIHRRLMGAFMIAVRSFVFRHSAVGRLKDTQCGFKLFTARAADAVFPHQLEEGFAFDVEVLALADRAGFKIAEVGVLWHNDPVSTVRPVRDSLRVLLALFRIRRRLR